VCGESRMSARRGKMRVLIEAAVADLAAARIAFAGGADRLELNSVLELDGLTPSLQTLAAVKETIPLPVIAMLRPRAGGFVYDEAEFAAMREDGRVLLERGADGLAFGFLTAEGAVDGPRTRELVQHAHPKESVFHRAFDRTSDPFGALETLIDLGVTRILTSGQQRTALDGTDLIRRLIERAAGRIEILPGAGISPENAPSLVARTGATQIHGSFGGGGLVAAVRAALSDSL
jgi:copper homeostasis protein